MSDSPSTIERAKREASGIAAVAVTGTWLALMLAGVDWWLPFMLFGYVVIVPVVAMLFDEEDPAEDSFEREIENAVRETLGMTRKHSDEEASGNDTAGVNTDTTDALQRLRSRYAAGELTDEQFENKLDRLLETETPEDAADWRRREHDRETERERERER
ncbi:SHOCT domain-containing protein [Halorubrum gandharaense]